MNLKKILLSLFTVSVTASSLFAQDILYKKNGDQEKVKIEEVGVKFIKYKKWDNLNGPVFIILKKEITQVQYENGTVESLSEDRREPVVKKRNEKIDLGKNILSVSPVWFCNVGVVGVGLTYERLLDKHNYLSFILPVAYSFNAGDHKDNLPPNSFDKDRKSSAWQFYPGLKFYPKGNTNSVVKYGLGISVAFIGGTVSETQPNYNQPQPTYFRVEDKYFLMGAFLWNTFNFQPTKHLFIGIDLGLGIPYYYSREHVSYQLNSTLNTPYSDELPIANFNFKIGYRF